MADSVAMVDVAVAFDHGDANDDAWLQNYLSAP